jgi:hypothetical protein
MLQTRQVPDVYPSSLRTYDDDGTDGIHFIQFEPSSLFCRRAMLLQVSILQFRSAVWSAYACVPVNTLPRSTFELLTARPQSAPRICGNSLLSETWASLASLASLRPATVSGRATDSATVPKAVLTDSCSAGEEERRWQ